MFVLARTATAVAASHAAKPMDVLLVASADAVKCHEFKIALMRGDAEVKGAGLRFGRDHTVRNIKIIVRERELRYFGG